ncbi:m-phase inducer phosphatase [Microbotryomycetes sp. JL221]|nr:m-phase inducer phosphatase [Microbotryomycetes sp. JL221]
MALISSSPGPEYQPHRLNLFQWKAARSVRRLMRRLRVPFPTATQHRTAPSQHDNELATLLSQQASAPSLPLPADKTRSSPEMMDFSPAPSGARRVRPASPRGPSSLSIVQHTSKSKYPLLDKLLASSSTSSSSSATGRSVRPYSAPVSRSPSPGDSLATKIRRRVTDATRPTLLHHSSLPIAAVDKPRLTFEQRLLQSKTVDEHAVVSDGDEEEDDDDHDPEDDDTLLLGGQATVAPPSPVLSFEPTAPLRLKPANISRHTAPVGGLVPPPMPQKRLSEPSMPTYHARSSPSHMDVDLSSPRAHYSPASVAGVVIDGDNNPFLSTAADEPESPEVGNESIASSASGASEGLADYFGDELSPIPQSRKRFLADDPHSPSPANVGSPSLASAATTFLPKPNRRSLEKSVTVATVGGTLRRPRSSANLRKRPSSSALGALPPPPPPPVNVTQQPPAGPLMFKRHASAIDGKPKSMRRAYSVADAVVPGLHLRKAHGVNDISRSRAEQDDSTSLSNRASIATEVGYFGGPSPLANPRTASMDLGSSCEKMTRMMTLHENGSPVTGFRSQEAKGKALPCFGVKEDGLMRISAATLNDVQSGMYSSLFARYLVIDCRFAYEYQGGHIDGAINLSELEAVEAALLNINEPPQPCTSESAQPQGKTVLIFHCEFSAKRAPTTAKHLRNSDRHKNHAVYPNIHYPEVYVLQGGYAEFFKSFPERCTGGYLAMDDPNRLAERSVNLNNFRNQKRQFQRANTFTFGQAQHASIMLKSAGTLAAPKDRMTAPSPTIGPDSNVRAKAVRRGGFHLLPTKDENKAPDGFDRSFEFPASKKGAATTTHVLASNDTTNMMTACHEEDTEADCSFGSTNGSSPDKGDSPCPTNKLGRHSLKIPMMMLGGTGAGGRGGRRALERAQTSSILMFTR